MLQKYPGLILVLAVIAGLVGGAVSNRFLHGFTFLTQQTPQQGEILRTQRVEIIDQEGKRRAWFGLSPQGNTGIGLYDQEGHVRAALSVTPDKVTGLMFTDQEGTRRGGFIVSPDGEPAVELYDKDKKCRIRLTATTDGGRNCGFTIEMRILVSLPAYRLRET